jgi:Cu-Zn family superoxide dismutase
MFRSFVGVLLYGLTCSLMANVTVQMYEVSDTDTGKYVGDVLLESSPYGLILTPKLKGLTPGAFGFHIHQIGNCGHMGIDAGGHYDPKGTGLHLGPFNPNGHLGDLPLLIVNENGEANTTVAAPKIVSIDDIKDKALMIHHGGDNYSDQPQKLGGGGARMYCGLIK